MECLFCGDDADNYYEVPGTKIMKNGGPPCKWAYLAFCDHCYPMPIQYIGPLIDDHPERLRYFDERKEPDDLC